MFIGIVTVGFVFELGKKALVIDSRQTSTPINVKSTNFIELVEKNTLKSNILFVNLIKIIYILLDLIYLFIEWWIHWDSFLVFNTNDNDYNDNGLLLYADSNSKRPREESSDEEDHFEKKQKVESSNKRKREENSDEEENPSKKVKLSTNSESSPPEIEENKSGVTEENQSTATEENKLSDHNEQSKYNDLERQENDETEYREYSEDEGYYEEEEDYQSQYDNSDYESYNDDSDYESSNQDSACDVPSLDPEDRSVYSTENEDEAPVDKLEEDLNLVKKALDKYNIWSKEERNEALKKIKDEYNSFFDKASFTKDLEVSLKQVHEYVKEEYEKERRIEKKLLGELADQLDHEDYSSCSPYETEYETRNQNSQIESSNAQDRREAARIAREEQEREVLLKQITDKENEKREADEKEEEDIQEAIALSTGDKGKKVKRNDDDNDNNGPSGVSGHSGSSGPSGGPTSEGTSGNNYKLIYLFFSSISVIFEAIAEVIEKIHF